MQPLTVEQVLDATDLGIVAGLTDVLYATIGGRDVLYALNRAEGVLHEISVAPDGTLTVEAELILAGGFAIGSEPALSLRTGSTGSELLIAGLDPAAGAFVTLDATGGLMGQTALPVVGELAAPVTFDLDRSDALLTGTDTGVDLYLNLGGGFTYADSLADTSATYLADTRGGTALTLGATPYVAVASASESGLTVLRFDLTGTISVASSFGAVEGLPVSTPSDMVAITSGDTTHLVLASSGSSSLTTLRVDTDGALWLEDHVLDSVATRFQAATTLDALSVGDTAFVAVGGADGGISLFTMLPNGRLVHLSTLVDTAETTLYRTSAIALSATATTLQIAVTSQWEAGITRLGYDIASLGAVLVMENGDSGTGTSGHDQIIGSDLADTLDGAAGDDILFDGAGSDVLIGGAGADLFVFAADGVADTVTDYQAGTDRLDLSAFDFLYDVSQLSVTPTATGAILSFGDEMIGITSSTGTPLSAADFTNADILNVDRPPVLDVAQSLTGGPLADILNGGPGADTITGASGNDTLTGNGGADALLGGDGDDQITGDAGDDVIDAGDGADSVSGGTGDDIIDGGAGDDILYGDDFDWM